MHNYELLLMYEPMKYPQFFENYDSNGMFGTFHKLGFYLFNTNGQMNSEKIADYKTFTSTLQHNNMISLETFNTLRSQIMPLLRPTAQEYVDIYLLLVLNNFYDSIAIDEKENYNFQVSSPGANRSFTDLCALGFYYKILKDIDDILPFFIALMKTIDNFLVNPGYCFNIDRFVFQLSSRAQITSILAFGDNTSPRDLCSFENWPFITEENTMLILETEGTPVNPDDEDDLDEDDDFYDDEYYDDDDDY